MENESPQDSRPDTLAHISRVQELIHEAVMNLRHRAVAHDASKLEEPEKSAFDRLKALSLSGMAYGSDEYRACLRAEKPAIEHHYKANSHHPEFYPAVVSQEAKELREIGLNAECDDRLTALTERYAATLESSINGMSLFDVLEMLLDWKAATERMKGGGDIRASLVINRDRFKISPQLESILANTIKELGW